MRRLQATAFLLLVGCANQTALNTRVWTVEAVRRHAVQLDGQTIVVRGWLPVCRGRDCTLYASKRAADSFRDNVGRTPMLSIGAAPEFDRQIKDQVPAEIVLRARVKADCFRNSEIINPDGTRDIIICADRSDDLVPVQIISLRRAATLAPQESTRR